jgi:isoamyl acetate esterase
MKQLILIGDSIRMGYQKYVIHELNGIAEVWAPTENGGNSANILKHLDAWVISRKPDILHINCGLHDLRKDFETGTPAIPLEQYEANLREFLGRIQRETDTAVVWATTTPVNEAWHHERKGFDRLEADVLAYNEVAVSVAQELGIPINDLFQVISDAGRDRLLTPDGVHFSDEGSALLGRAVAAYVKPLLNN